MATLPNHHIVGERNSGPDNGAGPDAGARTNNTACTDDNRFANNHFRLNNGIRAYTGTGGNGCTRVNHCRRVNARRRNGRRVKPVTEPSITQIRIGKYQDIGRAIYRCCRRQNNGRSLSLSQVFCIGGISQKTQLIRACSLKRCKAGYLNFRIASKLRAEGFCYFSKPVKLFRHLALQNTLVSPRALQQELTVQFFQKLWSQIHFRLYIDNSFAWQNKIQIVFFKQLFNSRIYFRTCFLKECLLPLVHSSIKALLQEVELFDLFLEFAGKLVTLALVHHCAVFFQTLFQLSSGLLSLTNLFLVAGEISLHSFTERLGVV